MERKTMEPLSLFSDCSGSICVWLNGSSSSQRPVWKRLWNEAAIRYATDGAANVIVPRDDLLNPDVVSGDFDSIDQETLAELRITSTKVVETPDQNKTDLTKALELVAKDSEKDEINRVVILGGLSGRFDHSLATLNSLLNAQWIISKPIYVVDGENLLVVLGEATTYVITVDRRLLTGKCGIVPFCQRPTVATTTGFKWNLENTAMCFGGIISTSNELDSDRLTISTGTPCLFTLELKEKTNA